MIEDRKKEHLQIAAEQDVGSRHTTGLERYALRHNALPEMALEDVDTQTVFLGHTLSAPLLISAMTGGTARAGEINRRLAQAAQQYGLALNLGSLRAGLEQPELLPTYQVRDVAPDVFLMANLGAVQLNYGLTIEACLEAVAAMDADALVLHLNPLQEAIQPDGDTDFRGILPQIAALCRAAPFPIIVKEVGWGISAELALKLEQAGVAAIDVAGSGGTSWSRVEAYRVTTTAEAQIAAAFDDWGIPTATALIQARAACPDIPLIASGGIDTGVDIVKCLALGANLAGIARPLLAAALESSQALQQQISIILRQLRIAMFCLGAARVSTISPDMVYPKDV